MVLGWILIDDSHFVAVAGSLKPEDFALDKHRIIYGRMSEMSELAERIDYTTLANCLLKYKELERIDGLSYLVSLTDGMPNVASLDAYIVIIRDKSILRKTIYAAQSIIDRAVSGAEDANELLGNAESMLSQLGIESATEDEYITPGGVIRRAGSLQKYLDRGKDFGVPTGFVWLDRMTCGMRPGQLWILAAHTAGGKSTMARAIARNAALRNYPGAFITLEMQDDEVTDGLICAQGEIDSQVIRRGLDFERSRTREAASIIADLPIYIRDRGTCTLAQLHAGLRKLKTERSITWCIVDYLQLMSGTGRAENRTQEVSQFSRGLKQIASDLKIPVLALSQFKRTGEVQRRPQLTDLRESGSIEQDANLVMFLYSEKTALEMEVTKHTEFSGNTNKLQERLNGLARAITSGSGKHLD
jgi:replicative DNA helicase